MWWINYNPPSHEFVIFTLVVQIVWSVVIRGKNHHIVAGCSIATYAIIKQLCKRASDRRSRDCKRVCSTDIPHDEFVRLTSIQHDRAGLDRHTKHWSVVVVVVAIKYRC